MHEPIFRAEDGDLRLEIFYDMDGPNPRKDHDGWLGRMLCWHGRYNLGDEQPQEDPQEALIEIAQEAGSLPDWMDYLDEHLEEETEKYEDKKDPNSLCWTSAEEQAVSALAGVYEAKVKAALDEKVAMLPLFLYDHSGITMSTGPFHCPWDSGQVGFIYMTYEKFFDETSAAGALSQIKHSQRVGGRQVRMTDDAEKELLEKLEAAFANREVTPEVVRGAEASLKLEVETYDEYLRGKCYGYVLSKVLTCDHGHEHEEELDSCWGFLGDDFETNGVLDNLGGEYVNLVKDLELVY